MNINVDVKGNIHIYCLGGRWTQLVQIRNSLDISGVEMADSATIVLEMYK